MSDNGPIEYDENGEPIVGWGIDDSGQAAPTEAAFGNASASTPLDKIREFVAIQSAPREEPAAQTPFSRAGRDYFVDPGGKLLSVEAGFDAATEYPGLKPATAEQVRARDIQKRSGKLIDQVETFGHTAAASAVETGAALYNTGRNLTTNFYGPDSKVSGKTLVPGLFGQKEMEQREANPTAAFLGAAVPDLAVNLIPGAGPAAQGARILASSVVTEAGNTVIEGDEFDMADAFGVYAPMQGALEIGGAKALSGAARALGWTRNAVNNVVERAQSTAARDALREVDPVKQASKLRRTAVTVYKQAQEKLDEALSAIDERVGSAPDKLFTPSALKKTVSNNINAQADAVQNLATQLEHAAEVTGAPAMQQAAKALDGVRGSSGHVLYGTLRQVSKLFETAASDNPLAREAIELLERTLVDENVWGKAARNQADALQEVARAIGPQARHQVADVAGREALDARLETARRVAALTGDKKLSAAAERAAEALGEADKVTGARLMAANATGEEVIELRKRLDAFPDEAPVIAERVGKAIEAIDNVAPGALQETWTAERIERHIAERAAGSKTARKQLDAQLDQADKWLTAQKRGGLLSPAKIARAEQHLQRVRDALEKVDEVSAAFKAVRDFDAAPRNLAEKAIDAVTGKVATTIASRAATTVAGTAAGYAGGGAVGGVIGAVGGEAFNRYLEPMIQQRATKFAKWLKTGLRKHGGTAAGTAALVGANRLAYDEDDPSPNAAAMAATVGLPFLLKGKMRLRGGDMPGRAYRVLDMVRNAIVDTVTPQMTLREIDQRVADLTEAWADSFKHLEGRAPNERELANARNLLSQTGWQQRGKLRKDSGEGHRLPKQTEAEPPAVIDGISSEAAAQLADHLDAPLIRMVGKTNLQPVALVRNTAKEHWPDIETQARAFARSNPGLVDEENAVAYARRRWEEFSTKAEPDELADEIANAAKAKSERGQTSDEILRDERLIKSINKAVDEMVAQGKNVNPRSLRTYTTEWLAKEFDEADRLRIEDLIGENIGDLKARAGRDREMLGWAKQAVKDLSKDGRSVSLESILARVGVAHQLTEGQAMRLEQVIESAGEKLLTKAQRMRMPAAPKQPAAAGTPPLAPGDMPPRAHELLKARVTEMLDRVDHSISWIDEARLRNMRNDQMSTLRNFFEYANGVGRRMNEREVAFAEYILETTQQAHFQHARAEYIARQAAIEAERNAPYVDPADAASDARRVELTDVDREALGRKSDEAFERLSPDEQALLRTAYEDLQLENHVTQFVKEGSAYGSPRSAEDLVRGQIALLRRRHLERVAESRGIRMPAPGTPAYGQMSRISPELEAAAEADFRRRNVSAAHRVPSREQVRLQRQQERDRVNAEHRERTEAAAHRARELMRDVDDEEGSALMDQVEAISMWEKGEAVDDVLDRWRKQREITPREEIYLRDQMGQDPIDWESEIDAAVRNRKEHRSGERGVDVDDLTVDELVNTVRRGRTRDLDTWEEYHLRQQIEDSLDSLNTSYREQLDEYYANNNYNESEDYDEDGSSGRERRSFGRGGHRSANGMPSHDELEDLGITNVVIGDPDGIEAVFGQALSKQDMRDLWGLDEMADFAGGHGNVGAELEVGENYVKFHGKVGHFEIKRTYTARGGGSFDIENDYFIIPADLQDQGIGKKILQGMAKAIEALGGNEMELSAAWTGKYLWPKLGYRPSHADEVACIDYFTSRLNRWTGEAKLGAKLNPHLDTIRDVADAMVPLDQVTSINMLRQQYDDFQRGQPPYFKNIPFDEALIKPGKDGKPDQFNAGKFFLLTNSGGWNGGLRLKVRPGQPWYDEYRRRIGLGAVGLGIGMHELIEALNSDKQTVWTTAESPAQQDENEAERILGQAEAEADEKREEREQHLDETRNKLAFLSHQGRQLMTTAARALTRPSNDNARTVETVPGKTASAGVARFLGSNPSLEEAFTEKRQILDGIQQNPMGLVEELAESYGELAESAPELHAQVTAQTFKVAQYITSKIPSTIGPSLMRPEGSPPNRLAIRQFALYYSAATDPSSVLTDVANNRVTKQQVETLREVWPQTYNRLKLAMLEELSNGKPTVSQRSRIDLLFDFGPNVDRAFSPRLVAALDQYRASKAEQGGEGAQAGKQAPSRRSQPSIVGTSATPQLMGPAAGPGVMA